MNVDDLRFELEQDLEWREAELRYLKNVLILDRDTHGSTVSARQIEVNRGLRALVVMSQAHTEGFAQVAFEAYVRYLNALQVEYRHMRPVIASASMRRDFKKLADGVEADVDDLLTTLGLGNEPPDDKKAIRRQMSRIQAKHDFVEKVRALDSTICHLDREVVEFEMNVSRAVLLRMLYTLGVDHTQLDSRTGYSIDTIRNARNEVAHGGRGHFNSLDEIEPHLEYATRFRDELIRIMCDAAVSEAWRSPAADPV